jgi:hypothetical protein
VNISPLATSYFIDFLDCVDINGIIDVFETEVIGDGTSLVGRLDTDDLRPATRRRR